MPVELAAMRSRANSKNAKVSIGVEVPCVVAFTKSTGTSSWRLSSVSPRSARIAESSFGTTISRLTEIQLTLGFFIAGDWASKVINAKVTIFDNRTFIVMIIKYFLILQSARASFINAATSSSLRGALE